MNQLAHHQKRWNLPSAVNGPEVTERRIPLIKIRGIYATALTRFFLDKGALIVCPSSEVASRFGDKNFHRAREDFDVQIEDRPDGQSVIITGPLAVRDTVVAWLRKTFWDAPFRTAAGWTEVELPAVSKALLDELRARVTPTVPGHHQLRIFGSEYVDLLEKKELAAHPEKRESAGRNLAAKLIWENYTPGREIGFEHVKPEGRLISLRPGRVLEADRRPGRLLLKREGFQAGGHYDGLESAKKKGDYELCEIQNGRWYYHHRHFRADGRPIGSYFNINTPVEFYPDRVRYIDLEIDTVCWPDGSTAIIDRQKLHDHLQAGRLSNRLCQRAEETARLLVAGRCG
jgi:hypothetical protein